MDKRPNTPTLLDYATIRHDADWRLPSHAHRHHEIIAVESGAMRAEIAGRLLQAGPGDVLFYRAGAPHKEWADPRDPATTLCLSYSGPWLADRLADCAHDVDGRLRQMLRWIDQDMPAGLRNEPARAGALVAAIVAELARLATPTEPPLVRQARLWAQDHLADRLTLASLAAQAHLSKYHFLRRYQALTGRTPMADIRTLRIDRARRLVVSTPWPLRRIAQDVGLSSEFHLSRLFRQHLGVSPSDLRRELLRAGTAASRRTTVGHP